MPTAMYSIYATVGLHMTVPRMPVLQLYESLILHITLDPNKRETLDQYWLNAGLLSAMPNYV